MPEIDALKTAARRAVDDASPRLREISLDIHSHPELDFKEHHAHGVLTDYLSRAGFSVTPGACGMATAFTAVAGSGSPVIAVLCEYDALPGIGHACGHNLIAVSGLAAGVALKRALAAGAGTIIVMGTPAEEGGGGKQLMIDAGAFIGVGAAMMLHPGPTDTVWFTAPALHSLEVEFHGKNAHAGMLPWEGVNALDAMVNAYVAVSTLRQQIRPTDRVHGVITDGGLKPNIIPDHTAAEFYVRSASLGRLEELKKRVAACFEGAAMVSGCEVELRWLGSPYADMVVNNPMGEAYRQNFVDLGGVVPTREMPVGGGGGSTDMGNVSYVVPSIHPFFAIPTKPGGANHTAGFTASAALPEAHENAMRAAKALALTAIDLYRDAGLMRAAKADFARITDITGPRTLPRTQ